MTTQPDLYERSLGSIFVDAVERAPDRTCVHHRVGEHSTRVAYVEMARRVASIVEQMALAGIVEGQRIVWFLDDVHDSIHVAIACAHSGVTGVPLDPRSSPAALQRIIERTQAVAVFSRVEHLAALGGIGVPIMVWGGHGHAGVLDLQQAALPSPADALQLLRARQAAPSSLYVIQPTSGTTGEPKLMRRTQKPFIRIGRLWRFPQADVAPHQRRIVANPLTHGAGMLDLWSGLAIAAELCVPSRPNVDAPLAEVRALDPHVLVLVPRIMRSLHRQQVAAGEPEGTRLLGPSAKVFAFGGAPCEPELQALLRGQGVEVVEIYGTSETGILVMTPPNERRPGWAGKPFDDVEIELDEDGELLARTPVMMEGYLGADDLTRESYNERGFYRTGDFAELEDGWVKIVGRKKDVFNTPTGNNIFPSRIEGMLEQIPHVLQAVVVGDARPYLVALVVLDSPTHASELLAQVKELNRRLEAEERVRRLYVVEGELPSDLYRPVGHGKVRRERKLIDERFGREIAGLYDASPTPSVWIVE